jgi:ElaB/YqjD/DUF883 family membrane-anchored ribosome-binding protein
MKNKLFILILCSVVVLGTAQADVLNRMKKGVQDAAHEVHAKVQKVGGHAENTLRKLGEIEKKALYDLAEAARKGYEKAKQNFVKASSAVKAEARKQLDATRHILEIALKNLREVNSAAANKLSKGLR